MGRSPEAAAQLRALVAGGSMGVGVLATDDCQRTYEELLAKGVTFLAEPAERPYGIEATLRDDSGNMMSLVQPFAFGTPGPIREPSRLTESDHRHRSRRARPTPALERPPHPPPGGGTEPSGWG